MRGLAGAPMGLVRALSGPRYRLGQTQAQDLADQMAERWGAAATNAAKAAVEQEYLGKFRALAGQTEGALDLELRRRPMEIGRIIQVVEDANCAAHFLDNAGIILPTEGVGFPLSPAIGAQWVGPANALVRRFDAVVASGKAEVDRAYSARGIGPPTPTPRVCPTRPPDRGERELESGEPGGRPRTWFDDAWEWVKQNVKGILLLGAWYAAYRLADGQPDPPIPRKRIAVKAKARARGPARARK